MEKSYAEKRMYVEEALGEMRVYYDRSLPKNLEIRDNSRSIADAARTYASLRAFSKMRLGKEKRTALVEHAKELIDRLYEPARKICDKRNIETKEGEISHV